MSFLDTAISTKMKELSWPEKRKESFLNLIKIFQDIREEWEITSKYEKFDQTKKLKYHFLTLLDYCSRMPDINFLIVDDILSKKNNLPDDKSEWCDLLISEKYDYKDEFNKNLKTFYLS